MAESTPTVFRERFLSYVLAKFGMPDADVATRTMEGLAEEMAAGGAFVNVGAADLHVPAVQCVIQWSTQASLIASMASCQLRAMLPMVPPGRQ